MKTLIAPVFSEDLKKLPALYPSNISTLIKAEKFTAESGEILASLNPRIIILGLGKKAEFKGILARNLGGKLGKTLHKAQYREITLLLPEELGVYLQEFLEGLYISQYEIAIHKSKPKPSAKLTKIEILPKKYSKKAVEHAQLLAQTMDYVRDLVNGAPNFVHAERLVEEASKIAKECGLKKEILGKKELTKLQAGGILSVNQGCEREPKLITLSYQGGKKGEAPIILVGKGVIFDTGGYNLKLSGNIETMNQDMAGAATLLGIMRLAKKLQIKKNIIAVMPIVENLINENAYRPSDVITMLNGKTVEITNTDAEGRLILADALHYALKHKPKALISIATLTGAAFIALGHRYTALLGNNESLMDELKNAGRKTDDLCWPLPIHEDYLKEMDSEIADYRNFDRTSGGGAGTAKAAAFLQKFVEGHKWAHLDVGGTAVTTRPKEYEAKGATASGLRLLLEYLMR